MNVNVQKTQCLFTCTYLSSFVISCVYQCISISTLKPSPLNHVWPVYSKHTHNRVRVSIWLYHLSIVLKRFIFTKYNISMFRWLIKWIILSKPKILKIIDNLRVLDCQNFIHWFSLHPFSSCKEKDNIINVKHSAAVRKYNHKR